jgi:hypothetical protein
VRQPPAPVTAGDALALQRSAGNSATVRAVARQPRPHAHFLDQRLELDPDIVAAQESLTAQRLLDHLEDVELPKPPVDPADPRGFERPAREASGGMLLGALTRVPEVRRGLENLEWEVYGRLGEGEKKTLMTSGITFGIGALGGMLATPGGREALSHLSGVALPVPKAPWLQFEFTTQHDTVGLGVHVDVGALLPERLGFGKARPQDPSVNLYGRR